MNQFGYSALQKSGIDMQGIVSSDQVIASLREHTKWIESKSQDGKRAVFDGMDLSHLNIWGASLFEEVTMRGVSLDRAICDKADISYADLQGSKLRKASFKNGKLACVNLTSVKLSGTSFEGATLSGAHLNSVKANWVDFRRVSLHKASLRDSYVRDCDFDKANLFGVDATNARLRNCDFYNVTMSEACLRGVDFGRSNLSSANLDGSDITGAILSQTITENWSVKGIICEYVYFDEEGKHRIPPTRNFEAGEFEELYSWFPGFTYYFKDSMHALDPYVISVIVSGLNISLPDLHLEIEAITGRGIYPEVKFISRGQQEVVDLERMVTEMLDKNLTPLRQKMDSIGTSTDAIAQEVAQLALRGMSMTKFEFNAPVQNVVAHNEGVVNIQAITVPPSKILEAVEAVEVKDGLGQIAKAEAVKELTKLAAGEVKGLTSNVVSWIGSVASELPNDVAEAVSKLLGSNI